MERWANCPGSVRLTAPLENKSGFPAAEGTVAHSLGELALNGKKWKHKLGTIAQQDGFDVTVTAEMIEAVMEYKVIVDDLSTKTTVRHVEHQFHIAKLHPALFGTADCVLWHPERRHLDVLDYKHGAGMAVEVNGNKQGQYYAVGAMLDLGYPAETIDVHIVQPRCAHVDGPHRTAHFTAMELLEFAADMVAAVKATEAPDAPLKVGPWCRKSFCPAMAICPAQHALAQDLAKREFAPERPYDPALLADTLDWLPVLEAFVKSVREFAYNEAEAGRDVPNYKLVEKLAREKWGPLTTPALLATTFGIDKTELCSEPELKSPAQVRKLVPGKNDKERGAKLAEFTVKESSGHTLVHVDDKRSSVKDSAKQAFACPAD
jgi:hypothetical protein